MVTTWNPADKGANILLSNGNLTAEANLNYAMDSVRATESKSSGKHYWEVRVDDFMNDVRIGVGNSSATLDEKVGHDANGWSYSNYWSYGSTYHNNVKATWGNDFAIGDIIGVALNLDTGKIWFAKNNVWQESGDPAAGTNEAYSGLSGSLFPMVGLARNSTTDDEVTARFSPGDQTYSPPSGFTAYESELTSINLFDGRLSINSPVNLFDGKARV
jgi:hypothetical protein